MTHQTNPARPAQATPAAAVAGSAADGAPSHNARWRSATAMLLELSIPLIAGVVLALLWANVDAPSYRQLLEYAPLGAGSSLTVHWLVNDVFMALFFGIATKEIYEACLPGGALNPPSKALAPLLATAGGVLGPVAVYLLVVQLSGQPELQRGWGVPTATDIALAWLVARTVFGARHPAVSFLLLLAIADDAVGLGIIAVFYPDPAHPVQPLFLLAVAGAIAVAYTLRRSGVRSYWPYLLGAGTLSWLGLHTAGLHPALALVAVVPFMPSLGRDRGLFADCDCPPQHDTMGRFEHAFKVPVDVGLFAFGLTNAGVPLAAVGTATWAVLLALLVGKTVGITAFGLLADRLGFGLPRGMSKRDLLLAGITGSLGLTVALFVAGVAFVDPVLGGAAKMGALFSAVAAPLVILLARLLGVRRQGASPRRTRPVHAGNGPQLAVAVGLGDRTDSAQAGSLAAPPALVAQHPQ